MKLLILTQKVDHNDSILGFFHRWLVEFSKHFESITVICLFEGRHDLPSNIRVFSLGKEKGGNRLLYVVRFFRYLFSERKNYSSVFVHMNQEYILLGGVLWKLFGKKIYLWRNHQSGNFLTDMAIWFSDKVFCTSKYSYTAHSPKTVLMPVGIATDFFKRDETIVRMQNSVLFLGRLSPVKRPELFIETLGELVKKGIGFTAHIVGGNPLKDEIFLKKLEKLSKEKKVYDRLTFHDAVPNDEAKERYNENEIYVNLSPSGLYDKTIFEAMATETLILTSNENLVGQVDPIHLFKEGDNNDLVLKLERLLALPEDEKKTKGKALREVVIKKHSLELLGKTLQNEIN